MDAQVTPLRERIYAREREIGTAAEELRAQIDALAARLRELDEEMGNLAVTRKTLLALPPTAPEPADPPPVLPAHPAYQQILDAFADAVGPMRARDLCERLDLAVTPKNIETTGTSSSAWLVSASSPRPNPACSPNAVRSCPPPSLQPATAARHRARSVIANGPSCGATAALRRALR
ncbi:hypothetical protein [Streptomyces sp. NPDC055681]